MALVQEIESRIIRSLSIYSQYRRAILSDLIQFLLIPESRSIKGERVLRRRIQSRLEVSAPLFTKSFEEVKDFTFSKLLEISLAGFDENPLSEEELEMLDSFVLSMTDRTLNNVQYQMISDVEQIVTSFKRFLMRVELKVRTKNFTRESALQSERKLLLSGIDLYRRDSLGRKRDTEQFVFTELRFGIYRSFNIAMIFILSKIGDTRARVERPGHSLNDTEFSLSDFETIEDTWFHPNASSIIMPV